MPMRKAALGPGLLINLLYLLGWVIALIGLAITQRWCKTHIPEVQGSLARRTFIASEIGKNCRVLFRFPWFIWALSSLPILLSLGHLLKPTTVRRGSAPLWAVLATLQMILTETLHDISHSSPLTDQFKRVDRGSKVAIVGFALMAAMALAHIIFESFLGDHTHRRTEVAAAGTTGAAVGTKAHHHPGAAAAPEAGGRAAMLPGETVGRPVGTTTTAEAPGVNYV